MRTPFVVLVALLTLAGVTAQGQIRSRRGQIKPLIRIQNPPPKRAPAHPYRIAPELPPALKLALRAMGNIRYAGTRIIETRNGLNRQRHSEYVLTDGMRSRIEFPADSPMHGQIILETATERQHYLPGRNEIDILPPQREEAFKRLAERVANGNVIVSEVPGGSVANLSTQLVSVGDRLGNVLQKLWIEPRTGMILRRELYGKGGVLVGSFEFTDANLNPIINSTDFNMPKGAQIFTPDRRLDQIVRRQGFQNVRLPAAGPYKLETARVQKIAEQEVLVQQYSGNGHRVALYQLKTSVDPDRLGRLAPAGVRVYSWQAGGSSFVLLGDLSDEELRDLGRRLGG